MRSRGFTLIEIMVALAIFGLLIALAGPQLATFLNSSQVRNASEAILNGVQQAQAVAIRDNLPTRFNLTANAPPNTATSGWQIWVTDPATNNVPAANPATPCGAPVACGPGSVCNPQKLFCFQDGAPAAQATPSPAGATAVTFDGFGRIQCNVDPNDLNQCDGSPSLQGVKITNSKDSSARELHVCIFPTDQVVPDGLGSPPLSVATSQIKLCDPNVAATEPQACPAKCI
jgi:type IV fimbrial biogenesis protein FimT